MTSFPEPLPRRQHEPDAMGIRLSACPKKSGSPVLSGLLESPNDGDPCTAHPNQRSWFPRIRHRELTALHVPNPRFMRHWLLSHRFRNATMPAGSSGFLFFSSPSNRHRSFTTQAFSQSKCKNVGLSNILDREGGENLSGSSPMKRTHGTGVAPTLVGS